ncbi:MAG: RDD family protein [Chitinophagaceae bacterium]|nr:RDD family protein [Chitinophagaceae bacterium]
MEIEMTYQNSLQANREATLGIQILAGLIDSAITLATSFTLMYYFPDLILTIFHFQLAPEIVAYILFAIYRMIAFLLFNGTVGMKTCRVHLLNGDLEQLSFSEKICAGFFVLINGVDYYHK